ncbi:hypothetical protein FN846DRAFT_887346 [Sphaerosporella brunnea]|uniref:Uncharacterized protein n=1 Tax=Sphaerosporella brunnea TaxID=1250544 RepID=A0A5J5F6W0_9PEZI|nr:hypothetical protein FN846DRAFT_887346 [Sphaerosporella brunnea]
MARASAPRKLNLRMFSNSLSRRASLWSRRRKNYIDASIPVLLTFVKPQTEVPRSAIHPRWFLSEEDADMNYRQSVPRAVATENLAEAGYDPFVKEANAGESFRQSLPSTKDQKHYALRFQQVTTGLREPVGLLGPNFHSADSQPLVSGLPQPRTAENAAVCIPPPPRPILAPCLHNVHDTGGEVHSYPSVLDLLKPKQSARCECLGDQSQGGHHARSF